MRNKRHQKKRFIAALSVQGTVYHATSAAGISRWTAYRWREDDLDFGSLWDEALQNAVYAVESMLYHQVVGNTLAAIFYLKAHRPIYRDRLNIDINQVREIKERIAQFGANPTCSHGQFLALTD